MAGLVVAGVAVAFIVMQNSSQEGSQVGGIVQPSGEVFGGSLRNTRKVKRRLRRSLNPRALELAGSKASRSTTGGRILLQPGAGENVLMQADFLPVPVKLADAKQGRGRIELVLGFDLLGIDDSLRSV